MWKPIETAPKDKLILVCGGEYMYDGSMYDDWFPSVSVTIVWWFTKYSGGWCAGNAEGYDEYIWHRPKYWTELPEPKLD